MKHDLFDLFNADLTFAQRAWRIAFVAAVVGVILLDLLVWRP